MSLLLTVWISWIEPQSLNPKNGVPAFSAIVIMLKRLALPVINDTWAYHWCQGLGQGGLDDPGMVVSPCLL